MDWVQRPLRGMFISGIVFGQEFINFIFGRFLPGHGRKDLTFLLYFWIWRINSVSKFVRLKSSNFVFNPEK